MTGSDQMVAESRNVTLLFSDIEGSTVLLRRLAGDWGSALDTHRRVCRQAWQTWSGRELGTEGDSFFVAFDNAAAAAAAAVQVQRELPEQPWPDGVHLQVRIGVHTGTPTPHGDGYVGMDVHRAARIAAAAHGGQVVVSNATAALVESHVPEGARLSDLGQHRLKDILELEHLYQLTIEGSASSFPPLRTLGSPTRLPSYFAPLLGREQDLERVLALFAPAERTEPARLVSLLAPGGTGKTRLAVAAAERLSTGFADGVHFVDLSEVSEAEGMWATLGSSLDLPADQRSSPDVVTQLSTRESLLVLDNLEQVQDAGVVVDRILQSASGLRVLATSRRPLHVPGEREYALASMSVPEVGAHAEAAPESSSAVQLFVQYATMAKASFALDEANTAAVVEICRRLDGLPLAIELVATRVKLFNPQALLARLDDVLDVGAQPAGRRTGTPRGARPGRQQTLRQAIAWSFDILDPLLQQAFATASIFVGPVGLGDLEAVLPNEVLDAYDVVDVVAELQDASLLVVGESSTGEPTVSMLETIRAYARDTLNTTGAFASVADAHAAHYATVGDQLLEADELNRSMRPTWPIENLRAALDWYAGKGALDADEQDRAALLHELCTRVSDSTGNYSGLVRIAERLLSAPVLLTPTRHTDLLTATADLAALTGRVDAARTYIDQAMAMRDRITLAARRRLLHSAATLAMSADRIDEARVFLEEERTLIDDEVPMANWLEEMAFVDYATGDYVAAIEHFEAAIDLFDAHSDELMAGMARHNLACALRMAGRADEALAAMRSQLPFLLSLNAPVHTTELSEDLGACLAATGHARAAAFLWGAVEASRVRHDLLRTPRQEQELRPAYDRAREDLGPDTWRVLEAQGSGRDLHELLQEIETGLSAEPGMGSPAP
jgi:predicted ATPase/class 3 adenylate cyclase